MNIVDVIILLLLGLGAVTGFIRGFFKQTVISVGTILVIILAFILKNPLSMILYQNLPFFKMGGLTSLNILLYETFAFIICVAILSIVLAIIIKVSGIIETILKVTVVLALPSKLLGALVGIINAIVLIYVALFIITMPAFKVPYVSESKYADIILKKTPIISNITNDVIKSFNEIAEFTKKEIDMSNIEATNRKIVEIMLKNEVTTIDSVKLLVEKGKIKIDNFEELVYTYERKED